MSPGARGLAACWLAVLSLGAAAPSAGGIDDPQTLLDRLEASLRGRDKGAYLALWDFGAAEARGRETEFADDQFAWQIEPHIPRPEWVPAGTETLAVRAEAFSVAEPRGLVAHWLFHLRKGPAGWAIVGREDLGKIDALVHLSLDPQGLKADGLRLQFEDFELTMQRGTLFTAPETLGPTVLVFVGDGLVRFRPRLATEQEQLRQFCGAGELRERVSAAFVRIHPADLHRVLTPARFEPDPEGQRRLKAARRFFDDQSERAFVLDADLPGSPWWLVPPLGDSVIAFETGRHGTLSFAVNSSDAEGISLFDRGKRRQICLYPVSGKERRYNEDDDRAADVLSHDLKVRFEPERQTLAGEDTLRMRLLTPALTVRLRLDQGLRVESITSREGGRHLFFRVRNQDSLMVSLGPLAGRTGELSLTVRYAGGLVPGPVDREVLQRVAPSDVDEVPIESVLVYTNRNAWYPQAGSDDYAVATMRFDTPVGYGVVTGGVRTSARVEGARTVVEYRQDQPGKYITAAVGRLFDMGERREGPVTIHGFGLSRTRAEVPAWLDRTTEILRFYADEFGPCPYTALNLAVIQGETPGGHSPPGMVVLSERPAFRRKPLPDDPGSVSSLPDFFLAHELAHQWWGHGVAGENYHERWLSEGAAQYAAALWVRQSHGETAFREALRRMSRWALRESDKGPISLGYRLGHLRDDPQVFRAVVYDKGAYVLLMLRAILGGDLFPKVLRSLLADHRFGKVGTDDFREALEAASGKSLAPYFEAWVYGTAVPALHLVRWSEVAGPESHGAVVEVKAEGLPGPVPLELAVTHDGGRKTERVTLQPGGGAFMVETEGRPKKVEINADYGLLAAVDGR